MTRTAPTESIVTIADPETGGSISAGNNGEGKGHRRDANNGRSREHRPNLAKVRPEQGTLVVEGSKIRVEGDRDGLQSETYFLERTLPTLRSFIGELVAQDQEHFTGEQEAHYTQVIAELANRIKTEAEAPINRGCESYLKDVAGSDVAKRIERTFDAQFTKGLLLIEAYAQEAASGEPTQERLNQEKALLVYAELMLNRLNGQLTIDEAALATTLQGLGFSSDQALNLGEAFTQIYSHVEPNLTSFANEIIDVDANFVAPGVRAPAHGLSVVRVGSDVGLSDITTLAPDDRSSNPQLNMEAVDEYLLNKTNVTEGAYRVLINALDRLNEPVRQRWITQREQNPEVDLTRTPLAAWQTQVEDRIAEAEEARRPLESKDYINGILGSRKEETKLLWFKGNHEVRHHIKNVDHKAPVREAGSSRDKLENVQATEIAIMAGVWQGEWNQGATAKPGESHPKEFYERVVDITVWSTTLNSADAVANFIDQLEAADAMQMDGEIVGAVLGNQAEVENAQAYRVPVLNHRGQPSFLVVDRDTYAQLIQVARTSQVSYARLAQRDARYAAHDRATRHAAFRPQLREHKNNADGWVDQERDFILAEEISRERADVLRGGMEGDRVVAGQLDDAMGRYRTQLNEFQMNFGRESRYRALAINRLTLRGVAGNAPDFDNLMRQEMNAVALEYMNRWNAFRGVTNRLLELRSLRMGELDADALAEAERALLNFLTNIDAELESQTRVGSTNHTMRRAATAPMPAASRSDSDVSTAEPSEVAPPELPVVDGASSVVDWWGSLLDSIPAVEGVGSSSGTEAFTPQDTFNRASFAAMENHFDRGYEWNESKGHAGYDAQNLREVVDRVVGWNSGFSHNPNLSKIAFVGAAQAGLPAGNVLVGMQLYGRGVDSSNRNGILTGVMVLSEADARELSERLSNKPDDLPVLVKSINGGPLRTDDRDIDISLGERLSIYSVGDSGLQFKESALPFTRPTSS